MYRRKFLKRLVGGIAGSSALLLGACSPDTSPEVAPASQESASTTQAPATVAQERVAWRMVTSWSVTLDIITGAPRRIADLVQEMTGGRFRIDVIDQSLPGAVGKGTFEAGHSASYYALNKHPAFAFATTVPFGLNAQQQNAWLYSEGGGLDLLRPLFQQHANVINFPAGNSGVQMGGWFKNEIFTPDDLRGLKMRIPGAGADVLEKLEAKPARTIPASEIVSKLKDNTIDAAEWIGPYDDVKLELHNTGLGLFYYYPGWWEPGATFDAYVNLNAWGNLSSEFQAIFKAACRDANISTLAEYDAKNREALMNLVKGGVQLRAFSPRILAEAQRIAEGLYRDKANQDAEYRGVYNNWYSFREQVNKWHWYNEFGYMSSIIRQYSA